MANRTTPFQWLMTAIGCLFMLVGAVNGALWGQDLAGIAPTWVTNHDDGFALICLGFGLGGALGAIVFAVTMTIIVAVVAPFYKSKTKTQ